MAEAELEDNGSGLAPAGEGWFVVNVRDAQWLTSEEGEKQPTGSECYFESGKAEFPQLGFRIHVLPPGQSNGLYHGENTGELPRPARRMRLARRRRRAAAERVGLRPLPAVDGAHLRWRGRRPVRDPHGRRARRRLAGSLPGVRVRRTPPGECGRGDVPIPIRPTPSSSRPGADDRPTGGDCPGPRRRERRGSIAEFISPEIEIRA
jgi:hypothetical protein